MQAEIMCCLVEHRQLGSCRMMHCRRLISGGDVLKVMASKFGMAFGSCYDCSIFNLEKTDCSGI